MNRQVSTILAATLPLLYASFSRHFCLSIPIGFYALSRLLALEKIKRLERIDWKVLQKKSRIGALLACLSFPLLSILCIPLSILPLKVNLEFLDESTPFLLLFACSSPHELLLTLVHAIKYEPEEGHRGQIKKLALEFAKDASFTFILSMHGMPWIDTLVIFILTLVSGAVAWKDRMPLYEMARGVADGIYKQA